MSASRNRLSRFLTDALPPPGGSVFPSLSDFYREEFTKCQRCLDEQREFYSERTISDIERALSRVISELDRLCAKADAGRFQVRLYQCRRLGKFFPEA